MITFEGLEFPPEIRLYYVYREGALLGIMQVSSKIPESRLVAELARHGLSIGSGRVPMVYRLEEAAGFFVAATRAEAESVLAVAGGI